MLWLVLNNLLHIPIAVFTISIILFLLSLFSIILLGFRYLASSIPTISLAGVAIGVGLIFSISIFAICRNPIISNVLIR